MTATAVYSATMPELRGEPAPSGLWSNYGGHIHMSPRAGGPLEPGLHNPYSASQHASRPRGEHDVMTHQPYVYGRYLPEEPQPYGDHAAAAGIATHPGYPGNPKRSFSQTDSSPHPDAGQDSRGDGPRATPGQDHKLLAFRRSQDKHTITDQHGRLQQLELSAQLHGMFFLSEMPSNATDGTALQPELTCYRRNLFQISGSLVTPRGPMSAITESGESVPISNMEVTISAIESVDGNPVRLVVIPWKTPPPNSPEVTQAPDQEPPALPLIPFQDDGSDTDGEYAVYPIGWRRLQFRIATANNGRRKELQQHFVLHLRVHATLANDARVVLTESTTAPIVVRGRSPRNFQARKEIPLLGSSAGSRGQALMETGMGVVAGPLGMKHPEGKPRGSVDIRVPRTAFTFEQPKPPGSQPNPMRSNSYPSWGSPGHPTLPQVPTSSPGSFPATTTLPTDIYSKVPMSGSSVFNAEHHEVPLQTSMPPSVPLSLITEGQQPHQPMRHPYNYPPSTGTPRQMSITAPSHGPEDGSRFGDDSRPAKRSRGHQPASSSGSAGHEPSPEYRYGAYGSVSNAAADSVSPSYSSGPTAPTTAAHREVYPPTQAWRPGSGEASPSVAYGSSEARPYPTPYDQYRSRPGDSRAKAETDQGVHTGSYSGGQRGSFEGMDNYSWSNT